MPPVKKTYAAPKSAWLGLGGVAVESSPLTSEVAVSNLGLGTSC